MVKESPPALGLRLHEFMWSSASAAAQIRGIMSSKYRNPRPWRIIKWIQTMAGTIIALSTTVQVYYSLSRTQLPIGISPTTSYWSVNSDIYVTILIATSKMFVKCQCSYASGNWIVMKLNFLTSHFHKVNLDWYQFRKFAKWKKNKPLGWF